MTVAAPGGISIGGGVDIGGVGWGGMQGKTNEKGKEKLILEQVWVWNSLTQSKSVLAALVINLLCVVQGRKALVFITISFFPSLCF